MKKLTLFTIAIAGASALVAQSTNQQTSTYTHCSSFYETIPLRDMPTQTEEQKEKANAFHLAMEEKREQMHPRPRTTPDNTHKQSQPDPVVQSTDGIKTLSAPIVNFDAEFNSGSCPNDPNGAVGPTQFVEMYNSSMAVYDKTGKLLKGPVDLATVFTKIPNDDGDPVVLYDKFADRWFISEFQTSTNPTGFSVGISKTNDATGAYYIYNFDKWTTSNYPDYLKFSIWTDGYYMTANLEPQQIMVLDRAMMLAGKPAAGMITQSYPLATPGSFSGSSANSLWNDAKIMDCDASALPPYGTPTFLVFFTNTNSGGASNSIIINKLVHDTAKHTLTITAWDSLAPASFNAYFNSSNFATLSQPTVSSFSTKALDALDGAFNFRVPYLMFTGYNSVVLSNTVNVGHNVAGIRWYELRQNTSTLHFSINQQGTYNPTAGKNRWNGAIAMDQDGDIGLAYSIDDSTTMYPSICYTGRMFADAASTMTGTETTAITGTSPAMDGTCGGTGSRWGDYSDMTIDPTDGLTFWHINEYDEAGSPGNRVFSFRLSNVSPTGVSNPIDATQFKVYPEGNYINVIANTLPSNDDVQVDLFEITGKQLSSKTVKPAGNSINEQISSNGLATGVYFVRVGNMNYQRVFKVLVK